MALTLPIADQVLDLPALTASPFERRADEQRFSRFRAQFLGLLTYRQYDLELLYHVVLTACEHKTMRILRSRTGGESSTKNRPVNPVISSWRAILSEPWR